eukprot:g203.t1
MNGAKHIEAKENNVLDLTLQCSSEENASPVHLSELEEFIKHRRRRRRPSLTPIGQNLQLETRTNLRQPNKALKDKSSESRAPISDSQRTPARQIKQEDQDRKLKELQEKLISKNQEQGDKLPDPWWTRFPDFVPAVLLKARSATGEGQDPRTGDLVHVDYINQFSRMKTPGSSKSQVNVPHETVTADEVHEEPGKWITKTNGQKAYITSDGKEHIGKKAYDLHLKCKRTQSNTNE